MQKVFKILLSVLLLCSLVACSNPIKKNSGVYHTPDGWNSKSATLTLNEDGTCIYPNGGTTPCTWDAEGDTIQIYYREKTYTATVIDKGVLLHDCVFEKLN